MWTFPTRTFGLLVLCCGLFSYLPSSLSALSFSLSPLDAPALSALLVLHNNLVKRDSLDGLEGLVARAQRMVEAAGRERGGGVGEDSCSGWISTLKYCSYSPTESDGIDCVCSGTALERMAICQNGLSWERKTSFSDFANLCVRPLLVIDTQPPPLSSPSRTLPPSQPRVRRHRALRKQLVRSTRK